MSAAALVRASVERSNHQYTGYVTEIISGITERKNAVGSSVFVRERRT
nr:hypothetical protein [Salinigranum halophilum]